jgi:hypothetical protein
MPIIPQRPEKPIDYFDERIMLATMARYENNSFTNALQLIFNPEQIGNIISRYKLGTTRSGAVIFWQWDVYGRIRYGKAMHYLPDLHRDKLKHPVGVHSLMGKNEFNHRQCFFGEHLLSIPENKNKPVCIVESEKSACICSEVLPGSVWLATGGKNGIRWNDKNSWTFLSGRKVILFPDVDAHSDWVKNTAILSTYGLQISVYDGLIKVAPGTQQDIADHLINDILRKKESPNLDAHNQANLIAENAAVNTDVIPDTSANVQQDVSRAVSEGLQKMTVKNPALSKLMDAFDCEVISTERYEPQPSRELADNELMHLAAGLPDYNSFTAAELCEMLNIKPFHVSKLLEQKKIYFIKLTGTYCRTGCTPF